MIGSSRSVNRKRRRVYGESCGGVCRRLSTLLRSGRKGGKAETGVTRRLRSRRQRHRNTKQVIHEQKSCRDDSAPRLGERRRTKTRRARRRGEKDARGSRSPGRRRGRDNGHNGAGDIIVRDLVRRDRFSRSVSCGSRPSGLPSASVRRSMVVGGRVPGRRAGGRCPTDWGRRGRRTGSRCTAAGDDWSPRTRKRWEVPKASGGDGGAKISSAAGREAGEPDSPDSPNRAASRSLARLRVGKGRGDARQEWARIDETGLDLRQCCFDRRRPDQTRGRREAPGGRLGMAGGARLAVVRRARLRRLWGVWPPRLQSSAFKTKRRGLIGPSHLDRPGWRGCAAIRLWLSPRTRKHHTKPVRNRQLSSAEDGTWAPGPAAKSLRRSWVESSAGSRVILVDVPAESRPSASHD